MFSIANKAVKIMRANHICERFDFIFEEKKDRHLHVWILPRYEWMTECSDDIITNLSAIFDYALLNCKSDENFRRIKSVTDVVKNGYVG